MAHSGIPAGHAFPPRLRGARRPPVLMTPGCPRAFTMLPQSVPAQWIRRASSRSIRPTLSERQQNARCGAAGRTDLVPDSFRMRNGRDCPRATATPTGAGVRSHGCWSPDRRTRSRLAREVGPGRTGPCAVTRRPVTCRGHDHEHPAVLACRRGSCYCRIRQRSPIDDARGRYPGRSIVAKCPTWHVAAAGLSGLLAVAVSWISGMPFWSAIGGEPEQRQALCQSGDSDGRPFGRLPSVALQAQAAGCGDLTVCG
jgi:hypothetical protein